MKKNTIKAFTLVEMLIVIVIIGILIASLMPRMQSAQGRARDVARKNDLAQIQTAIITSQQDRGGFPGTTANTGKNSTGLETTGATSGLIVDSIADNLQKAGMSSVPSDPNGSNDNFGLGSKTASGSSDNYGRYLYLVAKRNGVANAGFVLMAKTEVEGGSNWVVCTTGSNSTGDPMYKSGGYIKSDTDLAKLTTCKSLTQVKGQCTGNQESCVYSETSELRYILLY